MMELSWIELNLSTKHQRLRCVGWRQCAQPERRPWLLYRVLTTENRALSGRCQGQDLCLEAETLEGFLEEVG